MIFSLQKKGQEREEEHVLNMTRHDATIASKKTNAATEQTTPCIQYLFVTGCKSGGRRERERQKERGARVGTRKKRKK